MSTRALSIAETTVGKKAVMAVTGAMMFAFVVGHMLGNLQVYLGPKAMNEYAELLHSNPTLLWAVRLVMFVALSLHVITATQLYLLNRGARPIRYRMKKAVATSYSARTMVIGGPLLAAYLAYHLAHLTGGFTQGLGYDHLPLDVNGLPDVFYNVVMSFRIPWCVGLYVVAQALLGLHLYHGAWSLFQSLGINHRRYNETLRSAATAVALAVVAGFLAVPIGVFLGYVK
jgi:succinate dehydrogenase / fumarate reductase cytochrome b subunit